MAGFFRFWRMVPLRWRYLITTFGGLSLIALEDTYFNVNDTWLGWVLIAGGAGAILGVGEII